VKIFIRTSKRFHSYKRRTLLVQMKNLARINEKTLMEIRNLCTLCTGTRVVRNSNNLMQRNRRIGHFVARCTINRAPMDRYANKYLVRADRIYERLRKRRAYTAPWSKGQTKNEKNLWRESWEKTRSTEGSSAGTAEICTPTSYLSH
jgi:predicted metal-binding protein